MNCNHGTERIDSRNPPAFCQYDWGIGFWCGERGPGLSSPGRSPDNEYLGCSHALAKGDAAQSQALRQSKLSTGIDEPPTLRAGGSWGLFGVA